MCILRKPWFEVALSQFVLSIWLLVTPLWTQEALTPIPYDSVPPKSGERCIVCGLSLTEHDVTLIVRGRRVPLKRSMVDSFLHNQELYFSKIQPKGALFQENFDIPIGVAQGGISLGWFVFGMYVLVALLFGGISGCVAVSKGLKPIPHFFIGLFFSAFGYLYVLARPALVKKGDIPSGLVKVPTTSSPVPCPKCGNTNHPTAKQCTECGANFDPLYLSEVDRIK